MLYSWYCHSWYPGHRWELGGYWRTREAAVYIGPIIVCYDWSMPTW
jgi:hypothetical protein